MHTFMVVATLPVLLVGSVAQADTLVDCSQDRFKSTNSPRSLMGWSRRHFEAAKKAKADGDESARKRSCEQAITMRGAAHCQGPDDASVREALQAALDVCAGGAEPSKPAPKKAPEGKKEAVAPKAEIDCSLPQFQSPNSARSLTGWANGGMEDIRRQWETGEYPKAACESTVGQRGAAHCKEPGNAEYLKLYNETFELCENMRNPPKFKGNTLVNCADKRFKEVKSPVADLLRGSKRTLSTLDTTEDFRIKPTCELAEKLAGTAHCRDPAAAAPKKALEEARAKCAQVVDTRAKKRAAAAAAEKKRQEDALKNRKIVKFPRSTFKGSGKGGIEAQMKKAMVTGRVAKSAGELLRVQAMGGWQPGRYVDTKVSYRKIMGTVLWKSSRNDGVCRFTSYKFIQDKAGGGYGPLRFKAFCNGCPEGWTKCP